LAGMVLVSSFKAQFVDRGHAGRLAQAGPSFRLSGKNMGCHHN
jgi:hypothetical protein